MRRRVDDPVCGACGERGEGRLCGDCGSDLAAVCGRDGRAYQRVIRAAWRLSDLGTPDRVSLDRLAAAVDGAAGVGRVDPLARRAEWIGSGTVPQCNLWPSICGLCGRGPALYPRHLDGCRWCRRGWWAR